MINYCKSKTNSFAQDMAISAEKHFRPLRNSCLGRLNKAAADFTPKCTFIAQQAAVAPPKAAQMSILPPGVKPLPCSTASLRSCNPAIGLDIILLFMNLLPRKWPRDGAAASSRANTTKVTPPGCSSASGTGFCPERLRGSAGESFQRKLKRH